MKVFIWTKNVMILALSVFFLMFGINMLIGSYHLKSPLEFVIYFFSASLMILICIVGILYFFFRLFPGKSTN